MLTQLKNQHMDIHRLWSSEGKPKQGHTHFERLRVRCAYKKAIKDAQKAPKVEAWSRLHSAMATNDTDKFWKSWKTLYAKNKTHLPPVVEGQASKDDIAEVFRHSFETNARPNNPQKVAAVNKRFSIEYEKFSMSHVNDCSCSEYSISLETVFDAVLNLKNGKSADDEDISAEHFLNAPFTVFERLHKLFNAMLHHSYVPKQFTLGTILPIVKDRQGQLGDANNYRGITISPIASKILEHALKIVFGNFSLAGPWQFGFRKKSSTLHSLYCLKETIDYYIDNGS